MIFPFIQLASARLFRTGRLSFSPPLVWNHSEIVKMKAAAGLLLLVLSLCGLSQAINGANRDISAQVQELKDMVVALKQGNTGRLHISPSINISCS